MKFRIILLLAALNVLTCTALSATITDLPTSNLYFDPSQDFTIAVDYSMSPSISSSGWRDLAFGIGDGADGSNSATVGMSSLFGNWFLTFGGIASVDDQNVSSNLLGFSTASDSGSLFVQYVANTGDVTVGRSTTQGAIAPTASTTFGGIQNQWNGNNLSVLFFARDKPTAESVFANFRILSGAPTAVPEPSQTVAASIGLFMMVWYTRRRRKRKLVSPALQDQTNG